MRKRTVAAALLAFVIMAVPTVAAPVKQQTAPLQADNNILINGAPLKLSVPAYVVNKTTMVPLRQIAEALGAKVAWKSDKNNRNIATVTRGSQSATITLGAKTLTANGRTVKLDVAPELKSNTTMVPLRALSESLGTIVSWDGMNKIVRIDDPSSLPVIGTEKKLKELLKQMEQSNNVVYAAPGMAIAQEARASVEGAVAAESPAAPAPDSLAGDDYSKTNVQVDGVDEADWAKTDGRFVYQLSNNRIFIADIADPSAPKLAATIEYGAEEGFYPQEMYVDNNRLVVIGQHSVAMNGTSASTPASAPTSMPSSAPESASSSAPSSAPSSEPVSAPAVQEGAAASSSPDTNTVSIAADKRAMIMPPQPMRSTVQTKVYELDASGQPKLTRQTELEGYYVSSRKIDSALYVITNKSNYIYYPMVKGELDAEPADETGSFEPVYADSVVSSDMQKLSLSDIRYFPESPDSSTMMIGALDLDRPSQEMQVSAYLGSGQTIYASTKHLYVAISKYVQDGDNYKQQTQLYKFRLDQGNVLYVGEGTVPGSLLNQFSMDEHNGYFRIATTKGDMWASGENRSTNNLYVLNEQMQTVGTLENLAPGERIYSVRFMGGRAYMVTFRNVDPLFAIDLRDPAKPAVLGQLKIPGYSDYLHPYDDNHIIGFGKDTVEVPSKGMGPDETMAFYQGMKIALFDVTDVNNPKEKFKEIIGDRGTGSELLYNHKALMFSKAKGLMAFPVELMEVKNKDSIERGGVPAYGEFVYQGAYVYHIDTETGFTLQGRITHLSQDDLNKSGQYGYDYSKSVRRILYAGETLYTLSDSMLKANDLSSLAERGSLAYPLPPRSNYEGGPEIMPLPAIIR